MSKAGYEQSMNGVSETCTSDNYVSIHEPHLVHSSHAGFVVLRTSSA